MLTFEIGCGIMYIEDRERLSFVTNVEWLLVN